MAEKPRGRIGGIAAAMLAFAGLSFALAASLPPSLAFKPTYAVLAAMALLAEFVPVELSRQGLRITFTLPYIAALAATMGPLGAMLVDVTAVLVAGLLYPLARRQALSLAWTLLNASVAAISVAAGCGAILLAGKGLDGYGETEIKALAFMAAYGAVNFLLVAYVDWRTVKRPIADNLAASLKIGLWSLAFYVLVGLVATIFAHRELPFYILFTLVPVWALRTGLGYQARMYEHYYETVAALSLMLQRAHPYTHGHLERVADSAEEVAIRLGLSGKRARLVREAAVLHDIGKIAVSEEILDKPAKLTPDEMEHVRRHPAMGAQILMPVKQFSEMAPWILHHHERPDGTGYPDRLDDSQIPIESKIIAVVDAFDAMTGGDHPGERRSYRETMTVGEALQELERCSGTQFDPKVVRAFRDVVLGDVA